MYAEEEADDEEPEQAIDDYADQEEHVRQTGNMLGLASNEDASIEEPII